MRNAPLLAVFIALVATPVAVGAPDRLVVHEWGTFTSLQDESGQTLSHINTDDEPVPPFVHGLGRNILGLLVPPTEMPPPLAQGAPRAHPQVTMRLETPVTYFHLPKGMERATLDVNVAFNGGWLTEFYPAGETLADGKPFDFPKYPPLMPETVGRLVWRNVVVSGQDLKGPETDQHVWLAPRDVRAANVTVGKQSERFLFYRGVGRLDAPLRVIQHPQKRMLEIGGEFGGADASPTPGGGGSDGLLPPRLWLVDVRPDGGCAFRGVGSTAEYPDRVIALAQTDFADADYAPDASALRADMHAVLVGRGLFDDEARAMLATWELSYFKAPGRRLFYTVPRAWTDRVLPLTLSQPADVTRVMIGRIELVTPRHRELLQQMAAGPVPDMKEVVTAMAKLRDDANRREHYNALASGRGDPKHLGVPVPPAYQAYLDLGRFRTAMVIDACLPDRPDREGMINFSLELQFPGTGLARERTTTRPTG